MDIHKIKNDDVNERRLLSFSDVVLSLMTINSESQVLAAFINSGIDCYIQVPPNKRVYAQIHNQKKVEQNSVFLMNLDDEVIEEICCTLDKDEFIYPEKLKDPYLLLLDGEDLRNLHNNGFSYPIIFNGALKVNLEEYFFTHENGFYDTMFYCAAEIRRYAIASAEHRIINNKKYTFTEGVKIHPSDIIVFERDFQKIKAAYFDKCEIETLYVANPYISILNVAAYKYYEADPNRKFKSHEVLPLLTDENYSKAKFDSCGSRNAERLSVIINRSPSGQGHKVTKQARKKIELTEEMLCHRKKPYFSDHLVLVNYLAQYEYQTDDSKNELKSLLMAYGLSDDVATRLVKILAIKPS